MATKFTGSPYLKIMMGYIKQEELTTNTKMRKDRQNGSIKKTKIMNKESTNKIHV